MKINQATTDLVKRFEGLELQAYCDPVGVLTVGYGYTNQAGFGPGVSPGDRWSEPQAEAMLRQGLERFAAQIRPLFKRAPTENQFGAMVSLAYNIGVGAFSRSTCLRRFNDGDAEGAAEALTWFNKAGGRVLRGLTRRRDAERELFLISDDARAEPTPKADAERVSPARSTTVRASATQVAAAAGTGATAIAAFDGTAQIVALACAGIIGIAALWIMRERLRKWTAGDR